MKKNSKRKSRQQDEGIMLARTRLDVRMLTRKIQEFDKLKYLLLDDDQRALFDYLPAPLVPSPNDNYDVIKKETSKHTPILQEIVDFKIGKNSKDYQEVDEIKNLY